MANCLNLVVTNNWCDELTRGMSGNLYAIHVLCIIVD